MGGLYSQQAHTNSVENFDSKATIQEREETNEKEWEILSKEFFSQSSTLDTRRNILQNTNLTAKDKNDLNNRLIKDYGKNKNEFDIHDSIKKALLDKSFSLRKAPNGQDFKGQVEHAQAYTKFRHKIIKEISGNSSTDIRKKEIEGSILRDSDGKAITDSSGQDIQVGGNYEEDTGILDDSAQKDILEATGILPSHENSPAEELQEGKIAATKAETQGEDGAVKEYDSQKAAPESCKTVVGDTCKKFDTIVPKKQDKKESKEKNYQDNEKLQTLKDSPNYPLLKGLRDNGQLQQKNFSTTVKLLTQAEATDENTIVKKALMTISDKEVQEKVLSFINGKKEVTQESFSNSQLSQHSQSLGIVFEKVGALEIMMANNYLSIPNIQKQNNKKNDFERSINITLNSIIKGNDKNFRKENNDIISKIRGSSNLEYKYKQLQILHKKDLINDAKYFRRGDKQKLIKKKAEIAKEFNERKTLLIKQGVIELGKDKTLLELKKKHEQIIEDLKSVPTLKQGEVMKGGKHDAQSQGNKKPEQSSSIS